MFYCIRFRILYQYSFQAVSSGSSTCMALSCCWIFLFFEPACGDLSFAFSAASAGDVEAFAAEPGADALSASFGFAGAGSPSFWFMLSSCWSRHSAYTRRTCASCRSRSRSNRFTCCGTCSCGCAALARPFFGEVLEDAAAAAVAPAPGPRLATDSPEPCACRAGCSPAPAPAPESVDTCFESSPSAGACADAGCDCDCRASEEQEMSITTKVHYSTGNYITGRGA